MANLGVQNFYYTRSLPTSGAVAIAKISTPPTSPSQLTGVYNLPYLVGDLSIRKSTTIDSSSANWTAPDYNQSVEISGDTTYRVYNQFFQITTTQSSMGNPMYYVHSLPTGVTQTPTVIDLNNNVIATDSIMIGSNFYHSLDGSAYRIRYIDGLGYLHVDLLSYNLTLTPALYAPSSTNYVFGSREITVATNGNAWIRFTQQNGYQILTPYNSQPNTPWYARVRFNLTPPAPEWANQVFLPQRPYVLATWVPGIVLDSSLMEFERKQLLYNPNQLPDVIILNSDYSIKYAIDGTAPGSPPRRGSIYPWKRGLIQFVDGMNSRIQVAVPLDPTDIVYAFYSYNEQDVVYTNLDINPFTNPNVRNRTIQFYYKNNGQDLFHYIYHQVIDPVTGPVTEMTNDPSPVTGTNVIFSTVAVGTSVGTSQFTVTDIRQRGGGLLPAYQSIPEAVNFWDLGFWDGKPYPIAGCLAVYVPVSVLNIMGKSDVQARVQNSLPVGTLAVIHYYDSQGNESV